MKVDDPDDIVIVQRVLQGDADSFRIIVRRYSARLHGFCLSRLGNPDDAADAVQDILVRAYRSLGSFKIGHSFASWLFAIAANRVRTRWGRETARTERERGLGEREPLAPASAGPEPQALAAIESAEVRGAVARLSWQYRVVVELYYFGGLSVEETAGTLGLGVEAVKTRLFRARCLLGNAPAIQKQRDGHIGGIQ